MRRTVTLPGSQLEIALGTLAGAVVGLTTRGVYVIDAGSGEIRHQASAPVPVRCGFALIDRAVYFGSQAELWKYSLPITDHPK